MLSKKTKILTLGLAALVLTQPGFGQSPDALMTWPLEEPPTGLAVGPDGQMAVLVDHNQRVVQLSSDGVIGSIDLEQPSACLAVGPEGIITVYSSASSGLVQYSAGGGMLAQTVVDGQPLLAAASALGEIAVVTTDQDHNLDNGAWGRVARYGAEGRALGGFALEQSVDLLSMGTDGSIAITRANNHQVSLFSAEGEEVGQVEVGTEVLGLAAGVDGTVSIVIDTDYVIIDGSHRPSIEEEALFNDGYHIDGEETTHSLKAIRLSAEGAVLGEVPLKSKPVDVAVDAEGFFYAAFSDRVDKYEFAGEALSSEFDDMDY